MEATKVDFVIGVDKGNPVMVTVRIVIGEQTIWKFVAHIGMGATLTFRDVSIPTDLLIPMLCANLRYLE